MTPPRWTGGSDADGRGEVDRRPRSQAAGIMDGMDRRPLPHAPDSGHHEVASDRGGERAAVMLTLIHTAKLDDVDPQTWLADVELHRQGLSITAIARRTGRDSITRGHRDRGSPPFGWSK